MRKERVNEIWGVLFLLLGLFTLVSLLFFQPEDLPFYSSHPFSPIHNVTGLIGAYLAFALLVTFGMSAFLIPLLFLLWSGCFFMQKVPEKKSFKLMGLLIALFSTSTLIAISVEPSMRLLQGGAVGYLAGSHLLRYFGPVGSYILSGSCLLLSLLLATDFLIYPLVKNVLERFRKNFQAFVERSQGLFGWLNRLLQKSRTQIEKVESLPAGPKSRTMKDTSLRAAVENEKEKERTALLPQMPIKVKQYRPDLSETAEKEDRPAASPSKTEDSEKEILPRPSTMPQPASQKAPPPLSSGGENQLQQVIGSGAAKEGEYHFPPLDLLKRPQKGAVVSQDNLQGNSKILEDTLAEFGIEVKVVEVEQGPVITRYELLPAPGVKVNSIAALSDDIALALKASSVRFIIPIPGKSAIGIEVPNSVTSLVYLRELVDTSLFRSPKCALPLALGKDTSGKPLVADLTAMPHILIAGTTGSGKTVCVNSIITGLLYACAPSDLKFVMVDPKMVELAIYNKIPHMLTPVVTDIRKAAQTLNWVVMEMENRYKLLATVGVRNIQSFNARPLSPEAVAETQDVSSEHVIPPRLPYIIVVIDELADLMMVAQDKVESAITRLAQLSRAVGIHLILATQRPSVDVITGVIKANFPARISFKVASKVDSRTVLDAAGADKLIGRGDMLFMQPGDAKPTRGQAALIVDEEISGVVKFVSDQARPEYHPEIQASQEGKSGGGGVMEKDELFDEAVAIVLETGQASTSNLQRRLRLGYTRAARIIDQMEAEGMIGPAQGAKPREIFLSRTTPEQEFAEKE